jgi:hypothetical protein
MIKEPTEINFKKLMSSKMKKMEKMIMKIKLKVMMLMQTFEIANDLKKNTKSYFSSFIRNQTKKMKSNRRKKFLALSNNRSLQRNLSTSIFFLLIFQKALTKSNFLPVLVK